MAAAASQGAKTPRITVIGAGMGGLAAALRLAAAGCNVTLLERHAHAGGKMRAVPTSAGPADAGPTVLTLRSVFDDLFACAGARLDDHVTLTRQEILARHFWPDGSRLDLWADPERSRAAVRDFAGDVEAKAFDRFCAATRRLFEAFDAPMMQAADPSVLALAGRVLAEPGLIPLMAPLSDLHRILSRRFRDPRLVQLFGRYATYVGGMPDRSPAVLSLIWQAEARGVWTVAGGMHQLAEAILGLAVAHGVTFRPGCHVARIERTGARVTGVVLQDGTMLAADAVVFNGDPRALAIGQLGPGLAPASTQTATAPRSLSARVWSFSATASGLDLAHHNVFFTADAQVEFDALRAGKMPTDQTLYLCAQDRAQPGAPPPRAQERFEIIANAAPLTEGGPPHREFQTCRMQTFETLARFGLTLSPRPGEEALTTPTDFARMFPGSAGSLYGQSPHGAMASFRRPRARSGTPGLYLAGGGTHPGAGVPMAALSGKHAAAAIIADLGLTSRFRRTDTPGGMSTGSAPISAAPSR